MGSWQYGGAGVHGSARQGLLTGQLGSEWNPAAQAPPSSAESQGGAVPPQHGNTQSCVV
jgi:hypothetical protein